MKFDMEIFKDKLIEVYVDLEYSYDEFEKVLRWIWRNFETTYNKDCDLYFGPTQTLTNLQKSFDLYVEQIEKSSLKAGYEVNHSYDEWMY